MLNTLLTLLIANAGNPWVLPDLRARELTLLLEVAGAASQTCRQSTLRVPLSAGGHVRFDAGDIHYEGIRDASGRLTLHSAGTRPLMLSGQEATGGRWSLGIDGRCGGDWHLDRTHATP